MVKMVAKPLNKKLTMIVTLGRCQDALVMMSELDEVDSVPLAVVSVDFLAALQVVQADREVFAACDEILSAVAHVNRVDLLLLRT